MSDVAIRVENLGKRYRIGGRQEAYKTLRESMIDAIAGPVKALGSAIHREKNESQDDSIWALKDVSFDVKHGEVIGIIGRNGAGKSTLLKVLTRITEPTEGLVEIKGRVGSLLEVGTGFHPELTGRENIYLNGAILGMKRVEINRRFDEIVDFSGVEKFLDTPVKRYSSGMQVRLAFSVAAHLEPEILLVDEVLAVGDSEFQKKCLGKMGNVAKEGRTILFVSHNMLSVESLCSRGLLFKDGRVEADGTIQETIARYADYWRGQSRVELRHRMDREGSGQARAVSIRILDDHGCETESIKMGDSFAVELQTKGTLDGAIIGVLVGTPHRLQMIRGYTWENLSNEVKLSGEDTVTCRFDCFPMMHGSYDIHVWIGQRLRNQQMLVDSVEYATSLTVEPRDLYGIGRMLDPLGGVAFCRIDWEILPNAATER